MEIRPIISALLYNKTRAILIALQVALTLAIVANAVFIIQQRIDKMSRPTGIDIANLTYVSLRSFHEDENHFDSVRADLNVLRALPGVVDVAPISAAPLSGSGNVEAFGVTDEDGDPGFNANRYRIDEHGLSTLGLKLIAGRDFRRDEVIEWPENSVGYEPVMIVTKAFADTAFPDGDALGKIMHTGIGTVTIIGIVEHMQASWLDWDYVNHVILQPGIVEKANRSRYIVRTEPGQREAMIPVIEEALLKRDPDRDVDVVLTQTELLERSYQPDHAMTVILMAVIVLLITVTTLGVVGLANSSVNQRTKQIGTRRALGARRIDVIRYFLVENAIVTSCGLLVGAVLAFAFNYWLVNEYSLARLDWRYVPIGFIALFLLGQLAVLAPARRAATVSPSVATRTV